MAQYDAVFWHYDANGDEYFAQYLGEDMAVSLAADEYDDIDFRRAAEDDIRENFADYRL